DGFGRAPCTLDLPVGHPRWRHRRHRRAGRRRVGADGAQPRRLLPQRQVPAAEAAQREGLPQRRLGRLLPAGRGSLRRYAAAPRRHAAHRTARCPRSQRRGVPEARHRAASLDCWPPQLPAGGGAPGGDRGECLRRQLSLGALPRQRRCPALSRRPRPRPRHQPRPRRDRPRVRRLPRAVPRPPPRTDRDQLRAGRRIPDGPLLLPGLPRSGGRRRGRRGRTARPRPCPARSTVSGRGGDAGAGAGGRKRDRVAARNLARTGGVHSHAARDRRQPRRRDQGGRSGGERDDAGADGVDVPARRRQRLARGHGPARPRPDRRRDRPARLFPRFCESGRRGPDWPGDGGWSGASRARLEPARTADIEQDQPRREGGRRQSARDEEVFLLQLRVCQRRPSQLARGAL
ncbi:MAG: alanine-rich protein SCI7.12c, partial [uncultured Thermomicrobiales bacterium]